MHVCVRACVRESLCEKMCVCLCVCCMCVHTFVCVCACVVKLLNVHNIIIGGSFERGVSSWTWFCVGI